VGIGEEDVAGKSVVLATSKERKPPGSSGFHSPSLLFSFYHC